MIKKQLPGYVLLIAPGIHIDDATIDALTATIEHFGLDSVCPLYPAYHRLRGRFECNLLYRYRTKGIELHKYCLCIRESVWNKLPTLDLHNYRWVDDYQALIVALGLQHGLVCNSLIYEA